MASSLSHGEHNCPNSNKESPPIDPNTPFRFSEPLPEALKQVFHPKPWPKINAFIQLNYYLGSVAVDNILSQV